MNLDSCSLDAQETQASTLLTLVLTTSPTPSIPSTELITSVLASLPVELSRCPLIITFDGYALSQRRDGRLKKGQIPGTMATFYPEYILNVKHLFSPCSEETLDKRMHTHVCRGDSGRAVTFLRQEFRQGFAFNVKCALLYTTTPYVLVLQHDWVFTSPTPPFTKLLQVLQEECEAIKYITFVARQSIKYESSRGGVTPHYGAIFRAARDMRRCKKVLKDDIIACLHFFDRPHICSSAYYRDIFAQDLLKRGDFLEDTFGCDLINKINAATTPEASIAAWQAVGTWMYYPDDGNVVAVRHTSGRTNLTKKEQEERIKQYISENRACK